MKTTLLLLTAIALLSPIHAKAELTSEQIRQCAYFGPDDHELFALSGKDSGYRYKFKGNEIYKIKVPTNGRMWALSPTTFPKDKGLCFSVTKPSSDIGVEKTDLGDLANCQTNFASYEKLTGYKLNEAFEAQMDYYRTAISGFMIATDAHGKISEDEARGQRGELKSLADSFHQCEQITPLSPYSQAKLDATRKDLDKALAAYKIKNAGDTNAAHSHSGAVHSQATH